MIVELCVHGEAKPHVDVLPCPGHFADWPKDAQLSCTVRHESHCPGGRGMEQAIITWCEEHEQCKKACDLEDDDGMYPPSLDHRFVEALLILDALASAQEER